MTDHEVREDEQPTTPETPGDRGADVAYPAPQEVRGAVGAPPRGVPPQQPQHQQPPQPGPQHHHNPQQPPQGSGPQQPRRPGSNPRPDGAHRTADSRAADPRPEIDKESRRDLGRYLLLVLAAVVVTMLRVPWSLAALALAAVAVVVGIRMILAARRTPRAIWNPLLVASIAMSGFVAFTSIATLVTLPAQLALQECSDRALTVSAQAACDAEFSDTLTGFLTSGG
ncbi:hypothetical protein [Serinibacter arcticus]|uniref:hypothetical protein n=1 Tax=Serinibacter arcticus TaxID=1655435 RepID=UPI0011B1E2D7|nr:hypothetical protein [Serinibacter arcticus]